MREPNYYTVSAENVNDFFVFCRKFLIFPIHLGSNRLFYRKIPLENGTHICYDE